MPEITRFGQRLDYDDYPVGGVHQMPDGKWVRYDDHLKAIEEKRKQVITEVEEALNRPLSDLDLVAEIAKKDVALASAFRSSAKSVRAAIATLKGGTDV